MATTRSKKTAPKAKKPAGAGGTKGEAILSFFSRHPKGARPADVAEAVGCSVGRVYETVHATPAITKLEPGV